MDPIYTIPELQKTLAPIFAAYGVKKVTVPVDIIDVSQIEPESPVHLEIQKHRVEIYG